MNIKIQNLQWMQYLKAPSIQKQILKLAQPLKEKVVFRHSLAKAGLKAHQDPT